MPYKDPDKQRAFQNSWVKKRRADWINEKGGKCANCGSTEYLEVDHIDRSLKTVNPREIWSRSADFREKELENCQVLCKTCHKAKTYDETASTSKICGTDKRYSKGCRCDLCRAAHADRIRRNREAKKLAALPLVVQQTEQPASTR